MTSIEQIRQNIDQEIFDYTQLMMVLSEYRKPRDVVTDLLRRQQVIRIRKGLYIFGPLWRRSEVSPMTLANLLYGPSVVSLDFALAWHGLIPEHVETITSISTGRSRVYETPAGRFTYHQLTTARFASSIVTGGTSPMNWLMSEPLKALADKVWADKRFQPGSGATFSDYLFSDLRLDDTLLGKAFSGSRWNFIEQSYASRKISLLGKYLVNRYGE
jgi:hypothetical protein